MDIFERIATFATEDTDILRVLWNFENNRPLDENTDISIYLDNLDPGTWGWGIERDADEGVTLDESCDDRLGFTPDFY